VSVQSKGFADAPDVILRGLQRLIWAKKVAVESSNQFLNALGTGTAVSPDALVGDSGDFNELLALGYMEKDKINVRQFSLFLTSPLTDILIYSITMMARVNLAPLSLRFRWVRRQP
jgi:hypothetical protein